MLTPEKRQSVALTVTNLRIILLSLIASVSAFLIFIVVKMPPAEDGSSMRLVGLAAAAGAVVAAVIVPMLMARQQSGPTSSPASDVDPAAPLLAGLQTRSIIRAAILEGVAMLNAFAYMQERQPESLVVAIALLLGIVVTIPFRGRTEEWLERELRLQRDAKDLRA